MKTVYPTKVSATLILFVSAAWLCVLSPFVINGLWIHFTVVLVFYFLLLYLMASIKYEINGSQLIVYQFIGKWGKIAIDINTIKGIEPTHTILSAPASSLDRLRISYNKYDDVVISPRRKEAFIRQLQTLNPQIVFKDRENP